MWLKGGRLALRLWRSSTLMVLSLLTQPAAAQDSTDRSGSQLGALWQQTITAGADPARFSRQVALALGLRFQDNADRLTPTLDSALARAVMAGGGHRDSPWAWSALARQLQVTHGSIATRTQRMLVRR